MKSEYTKSEWKVVLGGECLPRNQRLIISELGIGEHDIMDIRTICRTFDYGEHKEMLANAHLIAQAPKLYEALKVLLLSIRNHKQCTVCNGTGKRKLLDMPHECEFCWGSGLELETVPARLAIASVEGK